MAVEALCPICGAVLKLRDDMQGKKVRCAKCEQVFTAGEARPKGGDGKQGVQPRPAAKKGADDDDERSTPGKARAASKRSRDDDEDDEKPRAGASRRSKDDDDEDDGKAKAKRKRRFHDDEDDDDTPRRPAKSSGGGGGVVLAIIGGVVLVLLLVCGGGGFALYAMMRASTDELQAAVNDANNAAPMAGGQMGGPMPGFNAAPMGPAIASVDDALRDLNSVNQAERYAALDWLAKAKLEGGRQAQVSAALNPYLKNPDNGTRERTVSALKVWCTRDNVPGLVQILNEANPGPQQPPVVFGAIEVLGKLQDERGAAVWRFRDSAFSWQQAETALKAMGPAAGEKSALSHLDDPKGGLRDGARSILTFYGTKDDVKLRQVRADIASDDKNRRGAAYEYLANNAVVESERSAVAKALNPALAPGEIGDPGMKAVEKWYTADNVDALVKVLDDDRSPFKHRSMALLGKIKDVRGAEPVANRLTNGGDRRVAGDALIAMGPIAKPAVEKYATNPDNNVRREVDRILKSYGGDTTGLDLARLLADLKSPEGRRRGDAAKTLATMKPDETKRAEVAKALEAAAEDLTDRGAQEQAIKALGVWGTKDSMTVLLKIMDGADQHPNCKNAAIDVLIKVKDERVIKPLAVRLLDPRERAAAGKHLMAMGPEHGAAVENEVAAGLAGQDRALKIECAKILGAVGTRASIPALTKAATVALAAKPQHKDVATQCQEAIVAINARGNK